MTQANTESEGVPKPDISRFAFAMFDVLGFSKWITSGIGLQVILDSYHVLIERAVIRANKKGSLSAVQTPEGALLAATRAPSYAYF